MFTNKLAIRVDNKVAYLHEMLNMPCRKKLNLEDFEYNKVDHEMSKLNVYLLFTRVNIEYTKKTVASFFNGRYFESKVLNGAINQAYWSAANSMKDRNRSYIILVDIKAEETNLEVDVSATKLQVKFKDMDQICGFIGTQLSKLLMQMTCYREYVHKQQVKQEQNEKRVTIGEDAKKIYDQSRNRVDHNTNRLTQFYRQTPVTSAVNTPRPS